jgi:hypothetical protein
MMPVATSKATMTTRDMTPRPRRPDRLPAHAEPSREGRELLTDSDRFGPLEDGVDRVSDRPAARINPRPGFEGEELRRQSLTIYVCERDDDECLEPDADSAADLDGRTPRAQATYEHKLVTASAFYENERAAVTQQLHVLCQVRAAVHLQIFEQLCRKDRRRVPAQSDLPVVHRDLRRTSEEPTHCGKRLPGLTASAEEG